MILSHLVLTDVTEKFHTLGDSANKRLFFVVLEAGSPDQGAMVSS